MTRPYLPANAEIRQATVDVINNLHGTVRDAFDEEPLLFMRATLPRNDLVDPGDRIHSGVALSVVEQAVTVCAYLLRQVCTNGTVLSHVTGFHRISRVDFAASHLETNEVLSKVQNALIHHAGAMHFAKAVGYMRLATTSMADLDLTLDQIRELGRLCRIPGPVQDMLRRKLREDRPVTQFDVSNSITSVARDVKDPQVRWRLEELGGGVLVNKPSAPRPGGTQPKAVVETEFASTAVGD
jgi:hypothetical protein